MTRWLQLRESMSNVLEETIAKDGSVIVRFNPTAKMIVYAMFRAKNQDKSETEVCEMAKISPQALTRWRTQYGSGSGYGDGSGDG